MSSEQRAICQCAAWGDRVRINLGAETADLLEAHFVVLRDRNPWLRLARCRGCDQAWYVAVDTVDDDYYFRRLSVAEATRVLAAGDWPPDYDGFVNVWPVQQGQNFQARLHWPWEDEDVEVR